MRARRSAPARVAASAHNDVLAAAYTRATTELEDRLAEILEPILAAAAKSAAEAFRQKATDHLTASALRRADRIAVLRSGADARDLPSLMPLLVASGALEGVSATSTMVCVKPRAEEAEAIADPGGAPAEGLHVTLAVLVDVDESRLRDLIDALKPVAAGHAALTGKVGGYGEFRPPGCGILLPDVPGLVELRVAVTEALVEQDIAYARDHGYQPHITVDGKPEDGEIDAMLERTTGAPLHFDAILVVRGDQTVAEIPLVGPPPITASLTAAAPVDPSDIAFRVAQFERAIQEMRKALADGDAVEIAAARAELNDQKEKLQEMLAGATPTWSTPAGDEVLDVKALAEKIRAKTEPVRQALIETTMTPALEKAGLSFDVTNPLTQKALASTGEKVTGISETTRGDVMKVVQSAWESGLSIDHTAQMLSLVMQADARTRARTIARTELVGAVNGGSLAATQLVASATGSTYLKSWMTAPGAPHPRHELYDGLDGQTVALDEQFDVGGSALDHPGDPDGDPGEVINCFPGSTLVAAYGDARVGFRRRYRGGLVRVVTDGNHRLAGTPNHPVLTSAGWKPLALLREGDYLVCGARREAEHPGGAGPDVDDAPSAIEQVVGALARLAPTRRIPGGAMQFHGDGSDGEVEVVAADRRLSFGHQAALAEPVLQEALVGTREVSDVSPADSAAREVWFGTETPSDRRVGARGEFESLLGGGLAHPLAHGGRPSAPLDAELGEAQTYHAAADAVRFGERLLGRSFDVSLAKVIEVEEQAFHGDVFNLESETGAYLAGGVIAHNCRCTMRYVEADGEQGTDAGGPESGASASEDTSTPPAPAVETITPGDDAATAELDKSVEATDWPSTDARREARSAAAMTNDNRFVIRRDDGTLGGIASTYVFSPKAGEDVTLVRHLASSESGNGTALMRSVAADATTRGQGVELVAADEASGFYEKIGMTNVRANVYRFTPDEASAFAAGGDTTAATSFSADIGVTPFRAGEDDPVGFYESDKYGQFVNDVHDSASSYGVTVDGLDRVTGVWQGDTEPSVSLRIHDGEKGVRAYSANLGNAYHQDGVLIFGDHPAGDVMATFQNALPQDKLTEAMSKAGIDGGRFTADGRLQVIGSGPDFVKQLDTLADDIGPYDASAGRFELLERASGDYQKAFSAYADTSTLDLGPTPLAGEDAESFLTRSQSVVATTLGDPEVAAVRSYVSGDYESLNSALRTGGAMTVHQQQVVGDLDATISKAPALSHDVTLWRGVTDPAKAFGTADLDSLVGKTITDPGFGSTTTAENVGVASARGGPVMKILAPAGTTGLWVPGLARGRDLGSDWATLEREFLLPRGTSYEVVSVDGNEVTLRLAKGATSGG